MALHKKVLCEQDKKNCFAYREGKCRILDNTHFNRDCPFFKTRQQYEYDLLKYPPMATDGKTPVPLITFDD